MVIKSTGELESKSLTELLEIYNSLPNVEKINKFRDKDIAIKRTLEALSKCQFDQKKKTDSVPILKGYSKSFPKQNGGQGRVRKEVSYPCKDVIRKHNPNTKRAFLIMMLKDEGATLTEIMTEIGWDKVNAIEALRLLHSRHGYGLQELSDGKIIIFTKEDEVEFEYEYQYEDGTKCENPEEQEGEE